MTRQAVSRITDIASELENFLDDEVRNLSPYLFDELEDVAEAVDKQVEELLEVVELANDETETLESDIEGLHDRIEELESLIDDLESEK